MVAALLACGGIAFGGAQILLTPHHSISTPAGTVVALSNGEITLEKSATTLRIGTYGLVWGAAATDASGTPSGATAPSATPAAPSTTPAPSATAPSTTPATGGTPTDTTPAASGTALIGPTTSTTDTTVTRPITNIQGTLTVGTKVELNPNLYVGDPQSALGIPFTNVTVSGELGPMPAWQVAGTGSTWVIFVHGIDGARVGGLRPLPTLAASGLPTLLITYRNDVGAPPSPDGLIHLGETEWHDLDSAVDYAQTQGAKKFILYGDSMGGSIVTQFMQHSAHASAVVGMMLDAPVLNWAGVLQGQADRFHLGFLGGALKQAVTWRANINLADLDQLDQTAPFERMPVLLFQGLSDPLVPPAESAQFAAALPLSTYVPVTGATHIQSYNVDPASYTAHLTTFLAPFAAH
ncbi:MAG: hypothetical protein JWQ64_1170 [Subtercola sp.]|nr:hypothetical protein [Subtercola sp.]